MRVLVTGASGFVGSVLCSALLLRGHTVIGAVRSAPSIPFADGFDHVAVKDVRGQTDWSEALARVDCVIHSAAKTHVLHKTKIDLLNAYRAVNSAGTRRLAEQAANRGVRRLVYISSIKVNGERTAFGAPFTFSDTPAPEDPYGLSKWEAEQALWEISAKTGLEVVIVRSPLVYGPKVKGNLARLLNLVRLGLPLPLGAVQNKRSLIGIDNLVDILMSCVDHPAAGGQTFLVSDGEDLSTPDLFRHIAAAMDRSARLVSVPVSLLRLLGGALGKRAEIDRLVESLQIDSGYTRQVLGWTPPVSIQEGMRRMVKGA